MQLEIKKTVQVEAKTLQIHAKVADAGTYTLLDQDGEEIVEVDGYVPSFLPGDHYGDYIMLDVDMKTGVIKNWDQISQTDVANWVNENKESEE